MKRPPRNRKSREYASTLLIAMATIAIIAALVGVALSLTSNNGVQTQREQNFNRALNAADGALEYAFAAWKANVLNNGLRPPKNSEITVAAPTTALHPGFQSSGVTFSNFSVMHANQWGEATDNLGAPIIPEPTPVPVAVPTNPGWVGNASFYRARVTASVPSRGGPINVNLQRTFQITAVPLFQAAIFFENDIELHPGSPMTINGLVHTNNSLYGATGNPGNLKFLTNVSYVGQFHEAYNPTLTYGSGPPPSTFYPPLWADNLPRSTSTTVANQLSQTERLEPFSTDATQLFNTTDANPNNDGPQEMIEPPVLPATTYPDPAPIAATRLYNKANVRVTISRNPTSIVIRDGSNAALPGATDSAIRNALNVSSTTIYDRREASNVSLTNVNMKLLDAALVGMGSSFNGVFYIQDTTPATTTTRNAIRLQNGAVLNRDLSIASNNAVYVQGDYNTGGVTGGVHDPMLVPSNNGGNPNGTDSSTAPGYTKRSTAVMADAVMILSNNWNDANALNATPLASRVASHTTVNTAILGGIVPSNYNNSGVYSGGPHNLPRFLEDWSSKDFTYLGSIVQLFNSQQFNGIFSTSNLSYSPPNRRWGFESLFLTQPPPGTLQSVQYSRGRWERF